MREIRKHKSSLDLNCDIIIGSNANNIFCMHARIPSLADLKFRPEVSGSNVSESMPLDYP